jgi:hypothetical protein
MRITTSLKFCVVLIIVVGAYASGVLTVFNPRYDLGFSTGYEEGRGIGYEEGYKEGYNIGYKKGSDEGYEGGYASGYIQGNSAGHLLGYNEGYNEGYEKGLDAGYLKGVIDGTGRGYTIRDPTYKEVMAFIHLDKTDSNEYIEEKYVCTNFAADVKNNAFKNGYRCGYVSVRLAESGHAIVCFNTTDRGLIFIEPQSDEVVTLRIGKPYWDRSRYSVDYNDTVVNYVIAW